MKHFSSYIKESILDPERSSLSPLLFTGVGETALKKEVQTQILSRIAMLSKHVVVIDYMLIGSILTRRYTDKSDIDINILVSASDHNIYNIRDISIKLSGTPVRGTEHPIDLHVLNSKSDFDNANDSAEAVFDISKNKFIRKPIEKPFHIDRYMSAFRGAVSKIDLLKQDLADDLLDYEQLKKLPKDSVKELESALENELLSIEKDAMGLVDLYDKVKKDRAGAFSKKLTSADIREYGEKNRLPANVLYKLLERHQYISFLQKVKEIIGEDDLLSPKEADELSKFISVSRP